MSGHEAVAEAEMIQSAAPEKSFPMVISRGGEAEVCRHIEALTDEYIEFLRDLVRIPSVTGSEEKAQAYVKEKMRDLGILHKEVYCDDSPGYHETGRDYSGRPSLVGRVPGNGNANFILNAHIDTAPVENADSWTHHPFAAVIEGDRLYGRGALDDKAGIAMMLMLAEAFRRSGVKLPGDLFVQSVIEDEDSGNGTLSCTKAGCYAEGAIIIDGTWPWDMVDSHLGQMWLELVVHGKPAPACSQHRATNPIHVALEAIKVMEKTLDSWNEKSPEWLGLERPYWMNVGQIQSGLWPGSVPESCVLGIQIGFPPPGEPEAFRFQLLRTVKELEHVYPDAKIEHRMRELCVAPFWNPENRVTRALRRTLTRIPEFGLESPNGVNLVTSRGHCDLRHLRKANGSPAAACLYGPGGGKNPHSRDEYYRWDHFMPVAKTITHSVFEFYRLT